MRARPLLLTLGIASLAVACTGSPTTAVRQPRPPAFDGGMGMGSGNVVDSTTTPKAPTRTGAGASVIGASEPSAVSGMGMGSGN
jgi:hypothetical protein